MSLNICANALKRLKCYSRHCLKPILIETIPLGKYKGRYFKDVPLQYLQWIANKDFDQDYFILSVLSLKDAKKAIFLIKPATLF